MHGGAKGDISPCCSKHKQRNATMATMSADYLMPRFMDVLRESLGGEADADELEAEMLPIARQLVDVVMQAATTKAKTTRTTTAKKALTKLAKAVKGKLSPRTAVEPMGAEDVEEGAAAAASPEPKAKGKGRKKAAEKVDKPKEPRKANAYSVFTSVVTGMMKGEDVPNPRFTPVVNYPETSKARAVYESNRDELDGLVEASADGVDLYRFLDAVDAVVELRADPKTRLGFNALVWGLCPEEERRTWFQGWKRVPQVAVPGAVEDDAELS